MSPLRLGVIGCGAIARNVHLRNARRLRGVEVVALADPSSAALEAAGRLAPRAGLHDNADALLARQDVDAVLVSAASSSHAMLAIAVLEGGRHLYLEKPVALTVADGERVAAAARAAPVVAAIGFNRRFHPLVLEARRRLRDGTLGAVVAVRTEFSEPAGAEPRPEWKKRRVAGGGAPLQLALHHVDLLRFLLGSEPVAVGAEIRSVESEDDTAALHFRFDECEVVVECSSVRPRCDQLELVDGDGRALRVSRYDGVVTVSGRPVLTRRLVGPLARAALGRSGDLSYLPALRAFVERVGGRSIALPTVDDGLASLRAILSAELLAAGRG